MHLHRQRYAPTIFYYQSAHKDSAVLEDYSGDDLYLARRTVGQSCSWDETITVLLDHSGDDVYSGGDFATCASHNNG